MAIKFQFLITHSKYMQSSYLYEKKEEQIN
jgi:hypothetical protein